MARSNISKKLRFEVFKRDSFTCQYCGKMAPDVILEVDHISPIKEGGDNDIMNLITACIDCNRGKGAKLLSDNQIIKMQQEQLKELSERREQLKFMLEWKKELQKFDEEQIDIIDSMLINASNCWLSDHGREIIGKAIKQYGIQEVIKSTELSISQYLNDEDISKVIDYIPRICKGRKKDKSDPLYSKKLYIRGILKNRVGVYNEHRLINALNDLVKDNDSAELIMDIARTAKNWTQFWICLNDTFDTNL